MTTPKPFVLVICDGWGERAETAGNAIAAAGTPKLKAIEAVWPHTTVAASGEALGLPEGQIGSSETGHMAIGAGRVILQPLVRQHYEIANGEFYKNQVLVDAVETAKSRGSAVHIMGLLSPGGVHSHMDGATALVKLAAGHGLTDVNVHVFTDGRDVLPKSAIGYVRELEKDMAEIGVGKIASIGGRYYGMDRDNRWDRIEKAYDVLTGSDLLFATDAEAYINECYQRDENDEFLPPISIAPSSEERKYIRDNDVVIFYNFRPDRARQITHALVDADFHEFERKKVASNLHFVTFTAYDKTLNTIVAFPKQKIDNTLAETVSKAGLKQFHVAETEKYAHVTYFLNCGNEKPFPGEDWLMIPSLKVATYDLAPAMSAQKVADAIVDRVKNGGDSLIVANFANADMVGHTGVFDATVEAIKVLDDCLNQVVAAALAQGGAVLITADHGNAEFKIDPETGKPLTAHTTFPVPVVLCGTDVKSLRTGGGLADIAPTILQIMNLQKPAAMTGESLAA